MRWFRALSRMKMAALMRHILRRHREGKHHDPDQERLSPTITAVIQTTHDLFESNEETKWSITLQEGRRFWPATTRGS